MIVLRLLAAFGLSVVLTGCQAFQDFQSAPGDIKAAKRSQAKFEHFFPQALCNAPGKHSVNSCYYKLQITQVLGNGQFKGRVPQDVIDWEDNDCKAKSPSPNWCPTRGDADEHPFTVDGKADDLQINTVAEFDSDPGNDHLQRR